MVYRWLDGHNPSTRRQARSLARDLAGFITALHDIDLTRGPPATRGIPLLDRDDYTREAIASLTTVIDTAPVLAVWDKALAASPWDGPPVWVHGDPACDLIVAKNLLPAESRDVYRDALRVDDATWERGRAWALSVALGQLSYYAQTDPVLVANSRHVLREILTS